MNQLLTSWAPIGSNLLVRRALPLVAVSIALANCAPAQPRPQTAAPLPAVAAPVSVSPSAPTTTPTAPVVAAQTTEPVVVEPEAAGAKAAAEPTAAVPEVADPAPSEPAVTEPAKAVPPAADSSEKGKGKTNRDRKKCRSGACAESCPAEQARCDGRCVDLRFDQMNCGACGNPCLGGSYCAGGFCQRQSRRGSCPYLFLWDGAQYRFHTDLSGSPLAYGLDFFKPAFYGANVYELGRWGSHDGVFRMRLRELIWEASYFDHALLVVADVPQGYEIFNEWSLTSQLERFPSLRYRTVHAPRAPVSALDDSGADVRAQLSAADGVPMPVASNGMSRVVLDFGRISHPERARLVLTTWGVYEDFRATQQPPYSGGTTVEVPDGKGGWRERLVGGKSASDARTWILDLAGVLESGDTRMRLTLAHQPSTLDVLDAVLLDDSEQVPFTLTQVAPRVAELRWGGASPVHPSTLSQRLRAEDLSLPTDPDALLAGDYTRYGDVRPLLSAADDRFVLMSQGDELYVEFDAPPQAPGTTRRAFLQADVFYTLKFHPFGLLTESIEPLPFHGMKSYPYAPEDWPYRDDPDYARYRAEWNTRKVALPQER